MNAQESTATTVWDALRRNGIIIERARREGRSLSKVERAIIIAGRNMAAKRGMSKHHLNQIEMGGERAWEEVLKPIKVVAVFSYYSDPFDEFPAEPSYLVRESNHPGFPVNGHVCAEQLIEAEIKVPKTPTYEKWVGKGKKVTRS